MNWRGILLATAYSAALWGWGCLGGYRWAEGDSLKAKEATYKQGVQDGQLSIIQGIREGKIKVSVQELPEA